MKRFPISLRQALAASSLVVSLSAGTLQASTMMVDWGGSYVSSYEELNAGTPTTSGGRTEYAYSDTTAINPAGPRFYGAFLLTNADGSGTPAFRTDLFGLYPYADADRLRFSAEAGASTLTMRGMIFFKKEDFIGNPSGPVTFDSTSSISLDVASSIGSTRRTYATVYALVGGEWNWYLSQSYYAGTTTYNYVSLDTMKWALYEPNNGELLPTPPTASGAFSIEGSAFEDIGAVGFLFNFAQTTEGSTTTFYVRGLEFTAVPEPSGVALAATAGIFGLAGLRKLKANRSAEPVNAR